LNSIFFIAISPSSAKSSVILIYTENARLCILQKVLATIYGGPKLGRIRSSAVWSKKIVQTLPKSYLWLQIRSSFGSHTQLIISQKEKWRGGYNSQKLLQ